MKLLSAIALLSLLGCHGSSDVADSALFGSNDESGSVLFAPGIISTEAPEFATSFSPDGRTVYFNRASDDRSVIQIFESSFGASTWTEPVALPFSDGTYRDIDPFVSIDGQRLYFSSDRPLEGTDAKDFDIWYVERTDVGWSKPMHPGSPLNGSGGEVFVSETRSGTLYFSHSGAAGAARSIVRAEREGRGYGTPEAIDLPVPDSVRVGNPAIAPDESFIIMTYRSPDGSVDLFISDRRADGTFDAPEPLPAHINSEYMDFAPYVTRDQQVLFFTSERPGMVGEPFEGRRPGDLYRVRLSRR